MAIQGLHYNQPVRVKTFGGTERAFMVCPASRVRNLSPQQAADLYNGVIDRRHEGGMLIEARHMESRLVHDPEAVLIGLLDGAPVAFINIVLRKLDSDQDIPKTHQLLTSNEEFSETRPQDGNYLFCPWVGVEEETLKEGFRAEAEVATGVRRVSLGQLMVIAAKTRGIEHPTVANIIAYSRPLKLRAELEKVRPELSRDSELNFRVADGNLTIQDQHFRYLTTNEGVCAVDLCSGATTQLIGMTEYWGKTGDGGRKHDPVFQMHAALGAELNPALVFPGGQAHDWNSLGFRTPLRYPFSR